MYKKETAHNTEKCTHKMQPNSFQKLKNGFCACTTLLLQFEECLKVL